MFGNFISDLFCRRPVIDVVVAHDETIDVTGAPSRAVRILSAIVHSSGPKVTFIEQKEIISGRF
jgi:hypothetical protein